MKTSNSSGYAILDSDEAEDDTDNPILARAHKDWIRHSDWWKDNQLEYRADIRFARLNEQWDEGLALERKNMNRPVLTINKLPPFIRQVVNDARQNKPSIKVLPQDSEADPKTAQIYSGLIRNIETSSDADAAYDTALDCSASGGFGFFRINLAYVDDQSFDQDLVFERIANPLTVYPDPDSQAVDSSDWNTCFVADFMPKKAFKAKFPNATPLDFEAVDWPMGWREGDQVMVAEYWKRETKQRTRVLLNNSEVVFKDEYEADPSGFLLADGVSPAMPTERERVVDQQTVTCYLLTGDQVIETREWAGKWIPIVPVWGEEVVLEEKKFYRSLIRDAKDSQVLYNVNRTAAGEAVARAPISNWVGEEGSFVDMDKWVTANKNPWAVLEHAKGKPAPQRVGMPQIPSANLQEALTASDEMKAIIGIYDAGLGSRSNETSGRAIMARQRESDVSTFHFIDNLSRSIRHAGRILIDMIPHVYTPGRIIRILGEDGTPEIVKTGTPEDAQMAQQAQMEQQETMQAVYALGTGRYDLTVTTGPAFNTRREEALTNIIELVRAYPPFAEIAGDLILKMQDFPYADELQERVKTAMEARQQPQGQPVEQPDPVALSKARTDQYNAQVKAQQGEQKLEIDWANAETKRLDVAAKIQQPTRLRTPVPADFTGG